MDWLRRFSLNVLEFFLPRLCLFCGTAVGEAAPVAVCPRCQEEIEWVASPLCTCCGVMFESRDGPDRVCGACQKEPPPFSRARAAALYDGPVAQAIKRLKFSRQMTFLPVLQGWLRHPLCAELAAEADLIVPVPLHPKRLKARGFNQSLLLARAFAVGPRAPTVLTRARRTLPQVGLNPKERRENVGGAFLVPEPDLVKRQKVLLVDDLFTTGATVKECARVLLKAGARQVEVVTVGRVRPE